MYTVKVENGEQFNQEVTLWIKIWFQFSSLEVVPLNPGAAQAYGQAPPGSPSVCLPALDWSWGCRHLPAEPWVSTPTWTRRGALWGSRSLTSPVLSIPSGLLYWVTSWQRCWWISPFCPGLWITSLADQNTCVCGTVCQMQRSATDAGPHKRLSSLLSSSPFTPQTSVNRQSLAISILNWTGLRIE